MPKKNEKVNFEDSKGWWLTKSISNNEYTFQNIRSKEIIKISKKELLSKYMEIQGRKVYYVGKEPYDDERIGDDPSSKQYFDRTINR